MTGGKPAVDERPPSIPILVVAVLLAAAGVIVQVPAFLVLWVGMVIAALAARPPLQPRSKAALDEQGERRATAAKRQWRIWSTLRFALFPSVAWSPWPVTPLLLATVGLGVFAAGQVVTLAGVWPLLRIAWADVQPIALPWLPVANGVAAFAVAAAVRYVLRTQSDALQERPQVTFVDVWRCLVEGSIAFKVMAALATLVPAGVGLFVAALLSRLPIASWVRVDAWGAAGLALLLSMLGLHAVVAPAALRRWREELEARSTWADRFAGLPSLKDPPRLIDHARHGADRDWWVDTFEIPTSAGNAQSMIGKHHDFIAAIGGDRRSAFVSTPAIGPQGPVEGTRHPSRFVAITWPLGADPDVMDPACDVELLRLWLQALLQDDGSLVGVACPYVAEISPLHAVDEEGLAGTPCWSATLQLPESADGVRVSTPVGWMLDKGNLQDRLGVEAIMDGDRLLFGVFDASTRFVDRAGVMGWHDRYKAEQMWRRAWLDAKPSVQQPPFLQDEHSTRHPVEGGATVHATAFSTPVGLPLEEYFKVDPATLATQIPQMRTRRPALVRFDAGGGVRGGETMPNAFYVVWADKDLPMSPARITPARARRALPGRPRGATDDPGPRRLIDMAVYQAFRLAKLGLPHVVQARALTDATSPAHIWDVQLRLYDKTIADLRAPKAMDALRNGFSCEYLRITDAEENNVRLLVGAPPAAETVWASDEAKAVSMRLDWEQAFWEAKVVDNGRVPRIESIAPLPGNAKVSCMTVSTPGSITMARIREAQETLLGKTESAFMDVRRGSTSGTVDIYTSLEQPLPFPAPFDWDAVASSDLIPFATGIDGRPIEWNREDDPHLMVVGKTRRGKSVTLQVLLAVTLIRGWDVYVMDPQKGAADFRFAEPWVHGFATDGASAGAMMREILQEVKRRKDLNSKHGVPTVSQLPDAIRPKPMLVLIDEFTSLVLSERAPKETGTESEEELEDLRREQAEIAGKDLVGRGAGTLTREAGAAGVSLIFAGQRLTTKMLDDKIPGGSTIKTNSSRLTVGWMPWSELRAAHGDTNDLPNLGEDVPKGRGIFRASSGQVDIVQTWFDGPGHVESMRDHIAAVREPLAEDQRFRFEWASEGAATLPSPTVDADGEAELDLTDLELDLTDLDLGAEEVEATDVETATPAEPTTRDEEEDWVAAFAREAELLEAGDEPSAAVRAELADLFDVEMAPVRRDDDLFDGASTIQAPTADFDFSDEAPPPRSQPRLIDDD